MKEHSIYDKILEKGKLEVKEILDEANLKAENLKNEILENANAKKDLIINNAKEKASENLQSLKTSYLQKSKQEILKLKKELIHKEFLKVLASAENFTDAELENYVYNKIKESKCNGSEVVRVNVKDIERFNKLFSNNDFDLAKLNSRLNTNFHLSNEPINIKGGFVLENELFDIDNSFEQVLSALEETLEQEVALMLFKGEE